MAVRLIISGIGAVAITLFLFLAMWARIAQSEMALEDVEDRGPIEFVRLKEETQTQTKKRELPSKQRPEPPPKAPDMDMPESSGPGATGIAVSGPPIDTNLDLGNSLSLGAAPADNDAVPVVRVEPMYPRRAAEQFIEGWVVVAFDILPTGATANVKVVQAEPAAIFDRAAVAAVQKWKYRPKVADGESKVTRNQKVRLTFELD